MELFDILQVPYNSSPEEVLHAYRRTVKLLHPDTPTGNHEKFVELQQKWAEFKNSLIPQEKHSARSEYYRYEYRTHVKVRHRHPPQSFYQNLQRRAQYGDTIKFYVGYEMRGMLIATGYYLGRYVQFYKVSDVDSTSDLLYLCQQSGSPGLRGSYLAIHGETKNKNCIESFLKAFVFKHDSVEDLLDHYDFSLFIDLSLAGPLSDPFIENHKDCERLWLKIKTTIDSPPELKPLLRRVPQVIGLCSPRRKKGICIRESNWYSTFTW